MQKSLNTLGRLKKREGFTALFLILVLVFSSLLTACGQQKQVISGSQSETSRPAESLPQSATPDSQNVLSSSSQQSSLPKIVYWDKTDSDMDFIYTAADEKYGSKDENTFTINVPILYGSETEGQGKKYFVLVSTYDFQIRGDTLFEVGGSTYPAAIIGTRDKNNQNKMICTDFIQAKDGSYYNPSIRKFCGSRKDIAEKIISGQGLENHDLILKENLKTYLAAAKLSPKYYDNKVKTIPFEEFLSKLEVSSKTPE